MHDEFVPVYKATNEMSANIIKNALEDAGIQVILRPLNMSLAFDGVIALAEGFWGDVLVHKSDLERATALLEEYAENKSEETPETEY
ncbi:MAG: putative signal transducing protein [Armatimonadota bacterium]